MRMRIKKGDKVIVIAGKDRSKQGVVGRVLPKKCAVIIDGMNLKKRHRRGRKKGDAGSIVEIASPIHVSNVQLFDSSAKKGVRVGYKMEGEKKVRISKKSGKSL